MKRNDIDDAMRAYLIAAKQVEFGLVSIDKKERNTQLWGLHLTLICLAANSARIEYACR